MNVKEGINQDRLSYAKVTYSSGISMAYYNKGYVLQGQMEALLHTLLSLGPRRKDHSLKRIWYNFEKRMTNMSRMDN